MNKFRDNVATLVGSTTNLTADEWRRQREGDPEEMNGFVTCSVARIMVHIVDERLANFHGCQGARLSRRQRIRPLASRSRKRRIALFGFKFLQSPILFFAPHIHLRQVEDTCIENVVLPDLWKAFVKNLIREWEGVLVYSSVLLIANVAFLALPAISGPPDDAGEQPATASEIASQISIITSVASIITSLLLRRYHKPKEEHPGNLDVRSSSLWSLSQGYSGSCNSNIDSFSPNISSRRTRTHSLCCTAFPLHRSCGQ